MKQYLISEEELIDYTSRVKNDMGKSLMGKLYKNFLKSKKPVEVIASGKVRADCGTWEPYFYIKVADNIEIDVIARSMKYNGKKGTLIFVPDKEE